MNRKIMPALVGTLLAVAVLFAGCAGEQSDPTEPTQLTTLAPTDAPTEPTTEPATEPPTEAPTEPQPTNPLTGEVVEAPLTDRIVAVTINNVTPALPRYGINEADLYFEMFVNDYATRGLALYTNIREVKQIGSVRSMRYNFTDIAVGYDAIVCHSGGSDSVLSDAKSSGAAHMNIDTSSRTSYSFRDSSRRAAGYAWEHCLFVNGAGVYEKAAKQGYRTTMQEDKDYGMTFVQDGTPAGGETAQTVSLTFNHKGYTKNSTFHYDAASGKYLFSQYGREMTDAASGKRESFTNVIVIMAVVTNKSASGNTYHVADLEGSGNGYYACGGKLIPITWERSGSKDTFTFRTADGAEVSLGVGNSYIGIAPTTSKISWS